MAKITEVGVSHAPGEEPEGWVTPDTSGNPVIDEPPVGPSGTPEAVAAGIDDAIPDAAPERAADIEPTVSVSQVATTAA